MGRQELGAERRERKEIVVISPHFDDVPLSLGESLRSGLLSMHRVRVRVAFGRTNWTSKMHPTPERAGVVSKWRRLEETAAGVMFGYRWTAANWSEVVLRDGNLDSSSFLDPLVDLGDDPLVSDVAEWILDIADSTVHGKRNALGRRTGSGATSPDLILVPAGLGGHRDHMIIAVAAAGLLGRLGVPVGFYEDRPYSAYLSSVERAEHIGRLDSSLEPRRVSGPIRRSTQQMVRACYPSQMTSYFTDAMDLDRDSKDVDTVWFPSGKAPEWLSE